MASQWVGFQMDDFMSPSGFISQGHTPKVFRVRMSVVAADPHIEFPCNPVVNPPYVEVHMVSSDSSQYVVQFDDASCAAPLMLVNQHRDVTIDVVRLGGRACSPGVTVTATVPDAVMIANASSFISGKSLPTFQPGQTRTSFVVPLLSSPNVLDAPAVVSLTLTPHLCRYLVPGCCLVCQ